MLGVLMMNTGTPDEPTPEAIRPYLKEFLSDRNLIDMPFALWNPILHWCILPHRPRKNAPLYQAIWTSEGSPFALAAQAQRAALAARLSEIAGEPVAVELGMRYGNPSIEAGLRALAAHGAGRVVALPLYPQTTRACAGTCLEEFDRHFARIFGEDARAVRIERYWDAPGYMDALAGSVRRAWDYSPGSKLIVSFHSIPMSHAHAGDPYPEQTLASARALADALGIPRGDVRLTYQSRLDKRTWLGPMLPPMLSRLACEQVKNVAVVCPGFSADCLETLHEVGMEAAAHFARECERYGNKGAKFAYIPALGADGAFIEAVAHLVAKRVGLVG